MDRREKSTLRGQHIRIADELILDEDFYAALRRDKIFTHGMIDMIKAEPKPRDRVYKMLELLEKRGPRAFDKFTNILKENYDWLAEVLEEEHSKRLYQDPKGHEIRSFAQQGAANNGMERYREFNDVNPRVQLERSQRPVSTPPSKQRNSRQTSIQATMSACLADKDNQQFFVDHYQPQIPQDMFDAKDNLTIAVPTSNNDYEKPKKYKDACMSPISVLESARKTVNTMTSPTMPDDCNHVDEPDAAMPDTHNQTGVIPNQTHKARKPSNEVDSAYSMTDDAESQTTEITRVSSSGFPVDETTDEIDGPKHLDTESAIDDSFPTSEIYYECVRRGSSCMPPEAFYNGDECTDETGTEISDDHMHIIPYEETEYYQENQDAMKSLFIKLAEAASDNADTDEIEEDEINWEMINEASDKLIGRLQNSDDMKMIRRCYSLFPEKERRHALNTCIQSLQDSKKEVENQLKNKQKEIEDMVHDLWKHQQDISNIKRLRKNVFDLENDNKNMKMSLENLEKDFEVKMRTLDEKDKKIQELETKLKESEPRRGGNIQRRGSQNVRQKATTTKSPQRQCPLYPPDSPRLSVTQTAYGNQSLRQPNTTGRRLPTYRR